MEKAGGKTPRAIDKMLEEEGGVGGWSFIFVLGERR